MPRTRSSNKSKTFAEDSGAGSDESENTRDLRILEELLGGEEIVSDFEEKLQLEIKERRERENTAKKSTVKRARSTTPKIPEKRGRPSSRASVKSSRPSSRASATSSRASSAASRSSQDGLHQISVVSPSKVVLNRLTDDQISLYSNASSSRINEVDQSSVTTVGDRSIASDVSSEISDSNSENYDDRPGDDSIQVIVKIPRNQKPPPTKSFRPRKTTRRTADETPNHLGPMYRNPQENLCLPESFRKDPFLCSTLNSLIESAAFQKFDAVDRLVSQILNSDISKYTRTSTRLEWFSVIALVFRVMAHRTRSKAGCKTTELDNLFTTFLRSGGVCVKEVTLAKCMFYAQNGRLSDMVELFFNPFEMPKSIAKHMYSSSMGKLKRVFHPSQIFNMESYDILSELLPMVRKHKVDVDRLSQSSLSNTSQSVDKRFASGRLLILQQLAEKVIGAEHHDWAIQLIVFFLVDLEEMGEAKNVLKKYLDNNSHSFRAHSLMLEFHNAHSDQKARLKALKKMTNTFRSSPQTIVYCKEYLSSSQSKSDASEEDGRIEKNINVVERLCEYFDYPHSEGSSTNEWNLLAESLRSVCHLTKRTDSLTRCFSKKRIKIWSKTVLKEETLYGGSIPLTQLPKRGLVLALIYGQESDRVTKLVKHVGSINPNAQRELETYLSVIPRKHKPFVSALTSEAPLAVLPTKISFVKEIAKRKLTTYTCGTIQFSSQLYHGIVALRDIGFLPSRDLCQAAHIIYKYFRLYRPSDMSPSVLHAPLPGAPGVPGASVPVIPDVNWDCHNLIAFGQAEALASIFLGRCTVSSAVEEYGFEPRLLAHRLQDVREACRDSMPNTVYKDDVLDIKQSLLPYFLASRKIGKDPRVLSRVTLTAAVMAHQVDRNEDLHRSIRWLKSISDMYDKTIRVVIPHLNLEPIHARMDEVLLMDASKTSKKYGVPEDLLEMFHGDLWNQLSQAYTLPASLRIAATRHRYGDLKENLKELCEKELSPSNYDYLSMSGHVHVI